MSRNPSSSQFEVAPDPELARRNWETIRRSAPSDLLANIENIGPLLFVLGLSWSFARWVVADPERFLPYFSSGRPRRDDRARKRIAGARIPENEERVQSSLLTYRQEQTLALLLEELEGGIGQTELEARLTGLAEEVLDEIMSFYQAERPKAERFFLLALGKFGGREMIYESDLDVIFLHSAEDVESVIRSAQRFIRGLTRVSPDGVLYAVDPDLRPHGRAGVLVISVDGFLKYHRESEEFWEKQALIKARLPGGTTGHRALEAQLRDLVFVRRDTDCVIHHATDMKALIEKNYVSPGRHFIDLKAGHGGIVDIEFLAQAGQMIFGHDEPRLRTTGTRPALMGLAESAWLTRAQADLLVTSYDRLKKVHGRLRLVEGRAVNQISREASSFRKLERALNWEGGEADTENLLDSLRRLMSSVRRIFEEKLHRISA